jgi:hypothetical protein
MALMDTLPRPPLAHLRDEAAVDTSQLKNPAYQAFLVLRLGFVVAPILFGIDKFFNWMTYWPRYLWVGFPHFFAHVSALHFMYAVGAVEILAGLLVLRSPESPPTWSPDGSPGSSPTLSSRASPSAVTAACSMTSH